MKYGSLFFQILPLLLLCACRQKKLFTLLPSSQTGIHFNNTITETDSMNPLNHLNIYNGGGVGIGDFNNDSLPDVYFTGNMVANKLYLNKGAFKFEDVTNAAQVDGGGRWCRGVSVLDINNDGWQDMYVSVSMEADAQKRKNLLYINQGIAAGGVPVFAEKPPTTASTIPPILLWPPFLTATTMAIWMCTSW